MPDGNTILFEAPQREGKTLSMVIWALDAWQQSRTVHSNIQLGFAHEPLEFSDVRLANGKSRFWNGHIALDELNFYFGNRSSMTAANIRASAFLLQQKKQGCNLTGTTHSVEYVDLRLREHHDFVVRPKVYPAFPARPILLKMVIENGPLQRPFRRSLSLDCRPFLGLYDTRAVYDPFKKQREAQRNDEDNEDDEMGGKPKRQSRVTL